jgi:aminopeptidase
VKARIEGLADLAVGVGANVQPGQIVAVSAPLGSEELVRAIAQRCYDRGARFVDPFYVDPALKRLRVEHAAEETLSFVPSWYDDRLLAIGEQRCARIGIYPLIPPGTMAGVDPRRAGKDLLPSLASTFKVINSRTTNWTIVPWPSVEWARAVHGDLPDDDALERLWEQVLHVCRLDESEPEAAWRLRFEQIERVAAALTARRFEALHFEGDGTDLSVGLLRGSLWTGSRMETADGIVHAPNIPTEETHSAPDPERVDGLVRATLPLDVDGAVVHGLRLRFEGGRAVAIEAEENAEVLRERCAVDDGACRLGEVALVDRESRIGALGQVFSNTLLDENAASHLALGNAYEISAEEQDRPRLNRSAIHVDFMIGSNDVEVTGIERGGTRVPVLRDGAWQI